MAQNQCTALNERYNITEVRAVCATAGKVRRNDSPASWSHPDSSE